MYNNQNMVDKDNVTYPVSKKIETITSERKLSFANMQYQVTTF